MSIDTIDYINVYMDSNNSDSTRYTITIIIVHIGWVEVLTPRLEFVQP